MHASLWLVSALGASVFAAPTTPKVDTHTGMPGALGYLSDYFNLLASKVQESRLMAEPPVCDLSQVQQPICMSALLSLEYSRAAFSRTDRDEIASPPLPPVAAGLHLKHIAIGRGIQNYTCDTKNETAEPVATGAVATLFNASCLASTQPDMFDVLPKVALQFNLTEGEDRLAPSNLPVSGLHYFNASGVPFFNLNTPGLDMGVLPCAKNGSAPAPGTAAKGQKGEPAVAWLQLIATDGATGNLQAVYRLGTAGGSPPDTCGGMPEAFEVQYSAQ